MEDHERLSSLSDIPFFGIAFLAKMLVVNVMLIVFNPLPAFPMDGGRVLRAILAMNMNYLKATQVAATVGQAMALLFGFLGLFFNPFLVFIALFVWMGAASEASMVQMKTGLQGIPVASAMVTEFRQLSTDEPIGAAARHIVAGFQEDFPVLEDGRLVGVLTKTDLLKALAEKGGDEAVGNVMRREFLQADPADMLETAFARLQECECHSIPVVRQGQLVGIVTMENVGEFLAIRGALRGTR